MKQPIWAARLGWLFVIWAASVLAPGAVALLIRLLTGWAGLRG
jgi:hypothetical protein